MDSKVLRILFLGIIFFSCTIFLFAYLHYKGENADAKLTPIHVIGSYAVGDGPWQEFNEKTVLPLSHTETIVVRGCFSHEIQNGENLMLYLNNLYLTLRIDGETILQFGDPQEENPFGTPGIDLAVVRTGYVSEDMEVEFVLQNAFQNKTPVMGMLFDSLAVGYNDQIFKGVMTEGKITLFASFFCIIMGIAVIMLSLTVKGYSPKATIQLFSLGCFTFFTGCWFGVSQDCSFLPFIFNYPIVVSVFNVISLHLMLTFGITLIYSFISEQRQKYSVIPVAILYGTQFVVLALRIVGVFKLYELDGMIAFWVFLVVVEHILLAYDAIKCKNVDSILVTACMIPVAVGSLPRFFTAITYSHHYLYIISIYGLGTFFFLLITTILYIVQINEKRFSRTRTLEKENMENRISIMLSQIQPHFLYNALSVVEDLCETDPAKAKEAVSSFSRYLRGNMRALTQKQPIAFEEELKHINYYLNLEKMRFGDRLNVVLDIDPKSFFVPALSVQPIVENAVKHGVTCRKSGGTVTIRTEITPKAWWITVEDDGVGFQPENMKEHVGIANARSRLASMCNATLEIESVPGEGTVVRIMIPRGEAV